MKVTITYTVAGYEGSPADLAAEVMDDVSSTGLTLESTNATILGTATVAVDGAVETREFEDRRD